ncbi:neprilysin-2-like isoform X2 [Cotesia typhae]|uniref:neprilysin-2-like isoform X2 n=1 Tax=Cotesia typhae TaxID=2053667 RepID=UPI003D684A41
MEHNPFRRLNERVLLLAVIGFISFLPSSSSQPSDLAARVMKYRDSSINPCDNFYAFACGGFTETDKADDYHLGAMANKNIKKLIQKGTSSEVKPYKLIDDIYKTCVNKNARGQQALELMKKIIKSLGNWPVLEGDKWKKDHFNWIDFTGNAKKVGYNINYFLDWEPKCHELPKSEYIVKMSPSDIESFMVKKPSQKQTYANYRLKIAELLGATGIFAKDMEEALDFEEKLLNISTEKCRVSNFTIKEFQQKWPSINWIEFVGKTLTPFTEVEKPLLNVWDPAALTELIGLLAKTPKRVQANYVIWKIVQYSVPYLTEEFRDLQKKFYQKVGYVEEPLEDSCVEMIKKYAGVALQYLHLSQYQSSQVTIRRMVEFIQNAMMKVVESSEAIDDKTKETGVKAVKGTPVTIGSMEELVIPGGLEKYYAGARVVQDNLLQTVLNLNLVKMRKPSSCIDSEEPGIPDTLEGRLHVPTTMIPGPFFNESRPMYMNFGASGTYMSIGFADSFFRKANPNQNSVKKQLECFQHYYDDLSSETKRKNLRFLTAATQ